MALKNINVGNFSNDGTGDDLRTAFVKVNDNFKELEFIQGQNNTISNIGAGIGLYKEKIGVDLRLKSLIAGDGIGLTNNANDVTITSLTNSIVTINTNTGTLTVSNPNDSINIVGGNGIVTSVTNKTITITAPDFKIENDPNPKLEGDLNLNGFNIFGGTVTADVTGNLTGNVYDIDVRELRDSFYSIDFGNIIIRTAPELLLQISQVDFGTFNNPNNDLWVDGGSII